MASKILGLFDSCVTPYVRSRERIKNVTGSGYEKVYSLMVCDDSNKDKFSAGTPSGTWEIVETDCVNAYERIQSHRDSTELSVLLKKYEMTGDESYINKVQGVFADITNAPKNLAEMYAVIQNGQAQFANLPVEIRKEYENNPYKFFEAISDGSFAKKFGKKPEPKTEPKTEPKPDPKVKDGESNE